MRARIGGPGTVEGAMWHEMKFNQLDRLLCTCGGCGFRVERAEIGAVDGKGGPDTVPCRQFCGFRQRPLPANGLGILDCRECQTRRILQGTLLCAACGRSWPIVDGMPSFSSRCISGDTAQGLRVVETDPQCDPRWEPFVLSHPASLIYHHPGWIKALELEYQQESHHLLCEDAEGQALAVMPMFSTRGLPFHVGGRLGGRRLSSLPRTPLGGPLSIDGRATLALLRTAVMRLSHRRELELQIKTERPDLDGLVEGLVPIPWRLSYLLQFAEDAGRPFRVANSHHRKTINWAVSRAAKSGVLVRPTTSKADLAQWYTLYLEAMRRTLVPPRPYRFFSALFDFLGPKGMAHLLLAEQHGAGKPRAVAGAILLRLGSRVSYAFSASRTADLPLQANDLILWEAINEACRSGARCFDLGEVPEGHQGLAAFKSKWGAEPVRLFRYYFPAPLKEEETRGGDPGRYLPAVLQCAWRRLPLKAVEWVGDRVYSYL